MSETFQCVKADIDMTETTDGSLVLQNKSPLASYPANLGVWLRKHAETSPDKHFLQQRDEQGRWYGLTYAQTLDSVNRISNGLIARGLDRTRPIAILSENSISMGRLGSSACQLCLFRALGNRFSYPAYPGCEQALHAFHVRC